ncbi:MAG: pantoate--beta-alanine ligase [Lentisphaerae bacterium GWF2_52_8]|nr:MAG: pantoate--beta-alanine ligase [Lentisphaerae bacterium GWF2_52_8]
MEIINTISDMQAYSAKARRAGRIIGLVPTMGFLHEGHMSLIDIARRESDIVIVSIFVNPTQFGPNEDFSRYPRDFERDCALCKSREVDAVFAPEADEMYPNNSSTWVLEEKLSTGLCGRYRPGHFRGVATIVAKLFLAALPDIAVFGQKDAQQLMVLKRMVRDLNFPIRVIAAPIVREADGLAMSSRNKYLSADERKRALSISQALDAACIAVSEGERNAEKLLASIREKISGAGGRIDYVEAVDAENLTPVLQIENSILFAVAAFFGSTRLIDNALAVPNP